METEPSIATTVTSITLSKHDGHTDGHLNCVALRHGWARTFSIPQSALPTLDHNTLAVILELHTLRLRQLSLRIFVEHPPNSGTWLKVKDWRNDTSLQCALIHEFLEARRKAGIVTRFDIRDGAMREESFWEGFKNMGSKISLAVTGSERPPAEELPTVDPHVTREQQTTNTILRWWPFNRSKALPEVPPAQELDTPPETPPHSKPSFLTLLRPHPRTGPAPNRRSLFDFFRSKPRKQPIHLPTDDDDDPNAASASTQLTPQEAEIEQLRKRGWIPPGLIRRQKSLRERMIANGGVEVGSRNPFFGSSKSLLSRAERRDKKGKSKSKGDDTDAGEEMLMGSGSGGGAAGDRASNGGEGLLGPDPFGDDADIPAAELLNEQELDDFFEVGRKSQLMELSNRPAGSTTKPWTRFKPSKDRSANSTPLIKGKTLGAGAQVVSKPRDAFPDSPHHRAVEDMEAKNATELQDAKKSPLAMGGLL